MKTALMIAAIVAAYMVASHGDYQAARDQHAYQCDMIEQGHWPESVNPHCEE